MEHVLSKDSMPEYTIMSQDRTFISTLNNYLLNKLGFKLKTAAPYNHPSLQT